MAPPPSTPDQHPPPNSFDETVEVVVGPEKKSFMLHRKIICFYSGYFERAFNGKFAEARAKVVTLPEEDVRNFSRCVTWLYTRRIAENDYFFDVLSQMWAFADRREIPMLMNACMDAIRDQIVQSWTVPSASLPYIYNNTTPTAGLRRFAVDMVAKTGDGGLDSITWTLEICRDLLFKVWLLDCSDSLTKEDVAKIDMCEYHQHEEGVKCLKKT